MTCVLGPVSARAAVVSVSSSQSSRDETCLDPRLLLAVLIHLEEEDRLVTTSSIAFRPIIRIGHEHTEIGITPRLLERGFTSPVIRHDDPNTLAATTASKQTSLYFNSQHQRLLSRSLLWQTHNYTRSYRFMLSGKLRPPNSSSDSSADTRRVFRLSTCHPRPLHPLNLHLPSLPPLFHMLL